MAPSNRERGEKDKGTVPQEALLRVANEQHRSAAAITLVPDILIPGLFEKVTVFASRRDVAGRIKGLDAGHFARLEEISESVAMRQLGLLGFLRYLRSEP
jgi:hypothetical protein